jgi:hypothetical protein
MSFPVLSTSVETAAIKRVCRVMARSKIARAIKEGQVYVCKRIGGSGPWSQHAWGNAVDLFLKSPSADGYAALAHAVYAQTTRKTIANLGRKLAVSEIIDEQNHRIWTSARASEGWRAYPNTGTIGHVHVSGAPLRTGTPPCAS